MPVDISYTKGGNTLRHWNIVAAKVEKGDMCPQRGIDIGNQGQDMNHGDLGGIILVDAAALITGRSLYHPEMLAKLTLVDIYVKLLCPEIKDSKQIVRSTIAIVPAIDQAKRLGTPVPTAARSHRRIHGALH